MGMFTIGMMILVFGCLLLIIVVQSMLEKELPDVFSQLGSPHIVRNNTPAHVWKFQNFLCTLEYRDATTGWLRTLCDLLFLAQLLALIGFAAFIYTAV